MTDLTVANTILKTLGGASRLKVMIGAHSLVGDKNSLTLKIKARALKGIKAMKITLEPSDTYKVELWSIRGIEVKKVAEYDGIYCDALRGLISRETGLALSL